MTYTDLVRAVQQIVGPESAAPIPTWIYLLEQELNSVLHRREMQQRATSPTTAGQQSYSLPTDFGEAIAMHVNGDVNGSPVTVLQPTDFDRIKAVYNTQTGHPQVFALTQNEFMLGPTPDAVYTLELLYYRTIPTLSPSVPTNWLLTTYPKIYYYGTLVEAAASMSEDPRSQRWLMAYQSALKILVNDQIRDRGLGGGPVLFADLPFGVCS